MFSIRSMVGARRMKSMCALPVFVGALAVGAVEASSAAATFGDPFDLSAGGQSASTPDVAITPAGGAVFVWVRSDGANLRIQARARSAAGALSAVQTLSPAGQDATEPRVAVDAAGDAVFSWSRFDSANVLRVQARARSAAGALSAVQTLSAAGQHALNARVAVDVDGDAVFVWRRSDGANSRIQARARSAAGALSAVRNLSPAGQDSFDAQVAVDADGDAVFAWRHSVGGVDHRVLARTRSAGGALSPVQPLSAAGQNAFEPQVAVEADGDAVFAWRRQSDTGTRVQARTRSIAGALSGVQNLTPVEESAFSPRVALDADGDAVFAWLGHDGANYRVRTRTRSAAGALGAEQTLSPAGQFATEPQVAVDADGDTVFAWLRPDHPGVDVVQARERTAAGVLFAVQTLSDAGQDALFHRVAVDADGDAISVWQRSDGTNARIQAALGP